MAESSEAGDADVRNRTVKYRAPNGTWTKIPRGYDPAELRRLVLVEEPDRWMVGSGDSLLTFRSRQREANLAVMYKRSHGFMLTHKFVKDPVHGVDMYLSVSGKPFVKRTSLFVGGDFFLYWDAYFISEADAWNAVDDFVKSGDRSQRVQWIKHADAPSATDKRIHGDPY